MSETATRNRRALIALFALVVAAVAVFAIWRMASGDDDTKADATSPTSTSAPAETTEPTDDPTPTTPTETVTCEGPNTSLVDVPDDTLLPDCGAPVVTVEQEEKSGLGLGCGGRYPVIMYKTTTSGSETSICGTTPSGEDFRMVTQKRGGPVLDMRGSYDPQRDAFVAKKDGTSYAVLAYDGSLVITENGQSTTEDSDNDWISLDNEDDFD